MKHSSTIHYTPGIQKTVSKKAAFFVVAGTLAAAVALMLVVR